jgi:hypothetical protein
LRRIFRSRSSRHRSICRSSHCPLFGTLVRRMIGCSAGSDSACVVACCVRKENRTLSSIIPTTDDYSFVSGSRRCASCRAAQGRRRELPGAVDRIDKLSISKMTPPNFQARTKRFASRMGPSGSCAGKMMVGSFAANALMARNVAIERSGSLVTPSAFSARRLLSE